MIDAFILLAVAVSGFAVAVLATPLVRRLSVSGGWLQGVRSDRWSERATPYLGGVAILLGFLSAAALGIGLLALGGHLDPEWLTGTNGRRLLALAGAGLLMFFTGLRDDLEPVMPGPKLVLQLLAAVALVSAGISFRLFDRAPLDVLLSLFWFVGMTNALNLLDNMDGLAGGVTAIAAAFLGVLFLMGGQIPFAVLAFALVGAVVGFLVYNVHPASIFMGDSGALFLGIFLGGLALAPAPGLSRGLFSVIALPMLILAVPILDTALVTAGRLAAGRPFYVGGRDHTSHRLVALGVPERRAVRVLWGLAAAGGGVGLLFRTTDPAVAYVLGGVLLVALSLFGAFLLGVGDPRDAGGAELGARGKVASVLLGLAHTPLFLLALDAVLFTAAYYAAYQLRWEASARSVEIGYLAGSLPLLIVAKAAAFAALGVYREDLRYFGLSSSGSLLRANGLGSLLFFAGAWFVLGPGLSRGVVLIDLVLATTLTGAARMSFRLFQAAGRRLEGARIPTLVVGRSAHLPVLLAHLRSAPRTGLAPVAFVDLEGGRSGSVLGVPRFGGDGGLEAALAAVSAGAIVVMEGGDPRPEDSLESIRRRLDRQPLPVYRLTVSLDALGVRGTAEPDGPSVGFMRH
ncbi:MAG: hypothetical protein R3E10_05220 [Gemmatimonadota bacterium]